MTDHSDRDYYSRREQQERAIAEKCGDPSSRRTHLELAERYAQLVVEVVPAHEMSTAA